MADKTFGVKVSEEMYEKVREVIEMSGTSSKEWFERAIALYEINAIKQGSSDYTQDLTELEHHTTRMYELIVNMIQRSVHLMDYAVKEVAEKLESKEAIITDLQQQDQQLKMEVATKTEGILAFEELAKELEEKFLANQTMLENNQALISEYKDKNDTLSGLVTKYQGYAEENEELKKSFDIEKAEWRKQASAEKTAFEEKISELSQEKQTVSEELRVLRMDFEQVKSNNERDLSHLAERKELERDKAVVEAERLNNVEVRKLYDEMAALRKVHRRRRRKCRRKFRHFNRRTGRRRIKDLEKKKKAYPPRILS
ncbi:chromosome segregation ATPase [Sporosarcina luteola]|nr:chromosome segregation ATPase [Sporosarcina luteola]